MGEQEQTKAYNISLNFDKNLCLYLFEKYIRINETNEYVFELDYFKEEINCLYEMNEKGTIELLVYLLKNVYEVLQFNKRKNILTIEEELFLEELNQAKIIKDAFAIAFFDNNDIFMTQILKYCSLPISDMVNIKNNAYNTKNNSIISRCDTPLNIFNNFIYCFEDLIFSKEYIKNEYKNIYLEFMKRYITAKGKALEKCQGDKESVLGEYQDSEEKVLERYYDVIKGLALYNKCSYEKFIIDICRDFIIKNNTNNINSNDSYKDTLKSIIVNYSNENIIKFLSDDDNKVFLKILLEGYNTNIYQDQPSVFIQSKKGQRIVNKLLLHHNKSKKELVAGKEKPKISDISNSKKHIGQLISDRFVKPGENYYVEVNIMGFSQLMISLYEEDITKYELIFASLVNDAYKLLKWNALINGIDEEDEDLLDLIEEAEDINQLYDSILDNHFHTKTLLYAVDRYYNSEDFGTQISLENYFNQVDLNPVVTCEDTLGIIEKLDYANKGFLFSKQYVKNEYIDLYNILIKKAREEEVDDEIDVFQNYIYILDNIKYANLNSYYQLVLDMYIEYYYQIKLMNEDDKDRIEKRIISLIENLSFNQLINTIMHDNDLLSNIVNRYSKYKEYSFDQRSLITPEVINKTEQKTLKKLYIAKENIKKRES